MKALKRAECCGLEIPVASALLDLEKQTREKSECMMLTMSQSHLDRQPLARLLL